MSVGVPKGATSGRRPRGLRAVTRGQILALAIVFVASIAGGYLGYQRATAAPVTLLQTVPVERGPVTASVVASGTVMTTKQARLSFGAGGRLAALHVGVGDEVKAGQELAGLDTTSLEIKLEQARSSLRTAQTRLQQLQSGASEADVTAARAAYESALARYEDLVAGPSTADLRSAEQAVFNAQANLQKAERDLAGLREGPSEDEILVAKAELEKRRLALEKAQGDYDNVAWRPDIGARPEALALQQATIDHQAAVSNYNIRMAPASAEDIELAEKSVAGARAALIAAEERLAQLKAGPKAADLEAARSSVASARASLLGKTAGPTEEELALQEEQIKMAHISIRQAELDLANAKIVAPFDGVVAATGASVGEQAGSGTAVLTIVDPSAVRIDATVDEIDLGSVAVGKEAQTTFDARPDESFEGRVIAIAPTATVQQGVVTYLVSVQFDPGDWSPPAGMTAVVNIIADRKDSVLVVPNRAIRSLAGSRVVEVLTATNDVETRPVRIGLSGEQVSEVLEGLDEGELVVIRGTTTALPRVGGFGASTQSGMR